MANRLPWMLTLLVLAPLVARAEEPLHRRLDSLIEAKSGGVPASPLAGDAEFPRRAYLDLAGRIPSVAEARAFLADTSTDKRTKLIDQLLASPDYAQHMANRFHIMLMERMGDSPEWQKYLRSSFEANKPWDVLAREILRGPGVDDEARAAIFFYTKRLENYGQNPVDYPALTRDVGRLFLGMDLRCAQCHDHIFIKDYKQEDFQGLFAFFQNTSLQTTTMVEKPTTAKLGYMSVFKKVPKETAPRIPGVGELVIPAMEKGKEYATPPDAKTKKPGVLKWSPLGELAEKLPTAENPAFTKNAANRLWFLVMGRGIVHPLDLHHSDNPPSHPQALDLLAKELAEHKFDMKWLIRELALTKTYQRSSMLAGKERPEESSFLTALEKRLSAEQLMWSMLEAVGEPKPEGAALTTLQTKFQRAHANPRREPEDEINPSLKAALFVLNDDTVLGWLTPKPGNLIDRLTKLEDAKVADELYLSVLTRLPADVEKQEVEAYLSKNQERRAVALGHLAWALLASTEFSVNH